MNQGKPISVAVVTGAARGIGLAISEWFLANGYRVAMVDLDADELHKAAAGVSDPSRVRALACDVSEPGQVQAMAQGVTCTPACWQRRSGRGKG
ncbi:MAG: SDR family NAD(P)-dependent oxidoreductase [Quisquiliibacterium sp.]